DANTTATASSAELSSAAGNGDESLDKRTKRAACGHGARGGCHGGRSPAADPLVQRLPAGRRDLRPFGAVRGDRLAGRGRRPVVGRPVGGGELDAVPGCVRLPHPRRALERNLRWV